MPSLAPIAANATPAEAHQHPPALFSRYALWLALTTLVWKLVEVALSAYAAITAHSPAMLAFGSDTLIELISAVVVLSQWSARTRLSPRRAARLSGILLILLALVVIGASIGSFALHIEPDKSRTGIAITLASLIAMPFLAHRKRREAHRIHSGALAADAVQSATCAFLALVTLLGLAINAIWAVPWVDNLAALLAVPILLKEARTAWHGHFCEHC